MAEPGKVVLLSNPRVFDGSKFRRVKSLLIDSSEKHSIQIRESAETFNWTSIKEIDASGLTVTPPFHDTHTHLLSYAANFGTYDIELDNPSRDSLIMLLRKAAASQPNSALVRVSGIDNNFIYNEQGFQVDRTLLDEAVPDRPLRIQTRSGHAQILNSAALDLAGIVESTDEPKGVTFGRRLSDGKLNGVFLEAEGYLDGRLPLIDGLELQRGIEAALDAIYANGINNLTDATHLNDIARYELLSESLEKYAPYMNLSFMPGFDSLRDFTDLGMTYKSKHNGVSLGPVKIMLTGSSGGIYPDKNALKEIVKECHMSGFPVAIHSVEMDSTDKVIDILSEDSLMGDRVEHASELRDDQIQRMAEISLNVSTQPSFIYDRGDSYLNSEMETPIDKLYRIKSLLRAGIVVAASSDCPVTEPDPIKAIYSAVTRRTSSGSVVNSKERVTVCEALKMLTSYSARISGKSQVPESIDENLLIIDKDLSSCTSSELLEAKVSWIKDFEYYSC